MIIGEILPGIMDELKRGVTARKENMRLSNLPDNVTPKMIELADVEAQCEFECGSSECDRDCIALTYAFALRQKSRPVDFSRMNKAILERFNQKGLIWIKTKALKLVETQK